jgi:aldehyde dehydrogenase (NAD+)
LVIDGAERPAASGEERAVTSPRDGAEIARVAWASAEDVDAAVRSARVALDSAWARASSRERSSLLLRLADRIEDCWDELAYLETIDAGKPITTMRTNDLVVGLDAIRYFAGVARTMTSTSVTAPDPDVVHHQLLEPIGVVAELLPWNGPVWTGFQRVAAIVAAGSTAVLKPSEMAGAPVLIRLAELMTEVGFPPGVVNVVVGDGATGEALVRHPDVDLISLTGGTATGSRVLAAAAPDIKDVSLELGGKNPNLVFRDGDLEQAAMWTGIGAFANSGQICVSGSRVLVQEPVVEEFTDRLLSHAESLRVGDPLDAETQMGPIVSETHAERVWDAIGVARSEGDVLAGGRPYEEILDYVTYVPPTVVRVPAASRTATEEIFGPVVAIVPFRTFDDAIEIANATSYGLSSGVFTRDVNTAWEAARCLQAGEVYINRWFTPAVLEAPSQGYKRSGLGETGVRKYVRAKNLFFQIDPAPAGNDTDEGIS